MISAAGMRHRPTSRKTAFAAGLLTDREDARIDAVMAAAQEALDRFAKAKPYWGSVRLAHDPENEPIAL
jgi:hypothetical protein